MIHEAVILRVVITNLLLVNRFHQKRGSNYGGRQKTQIRERKREHQEILVSDGAGHRV